MNDTVAATTNEGVFVETRPVRLQAFQWDGTYKDALALHVWAVDNEIPGDIEANDKTPENAPEPEDDGDDEEFYERPTVYVRVPTRDDRTFEASWAHVELQPNGYVVLHPNKLEGRRSTLEVLSEADFTDKYVEVEQ